VKGAEAMLRESREAAKGREKTLIRWLMENVFSDDNEAFEGKTSYNGARDASEVLAPGYERH